MPRQDHAKVSSHHFKNSKKIILGNLRNAREHCNSDVRTVKREDRILDKTHERTVRTEDRILEKTDAGTEVAEVGEKEKQKECLEL